MISVLLPSRGRPASLAISVWSLRLNLEHASNLEVLVAHDPDDPDTADAARTLNVDLLLEAPQRFGYPRLHEYYNQLAAHASGDWLMVWNDDAVMLTPRWDRVAAEQPAGLVVLHPGSNQGPVLNTFPIFTRELYDLLGHVSVSPHCDSYLEAVSRPTGIERRVPIEVRHDRYDLTGLHNDRTFADAQAGYRTAEFHSPAVQDQVAADIGKIQAALAGKVGA